MSPQRCHLTFDLSVDSRHSAPVALMRQPSILKTTYTRKQNKEKSALDRLSGCGRFFRVGELALLTLLLVLVIPSG